jgi:hypothetical protein
MSYWVRCGRCGRCNHRRRGRCRRRTPRPRLRGPTRSAIFARRRRRPSSRPCRGNVARVGKIEALVPVGGGGATYFTATPNSLREGESRRCSAAGCDWASCATTALGAAAPLERMAMAVLAWVERFASPSLSPWHDCPGSISSSAARSLMPGVLHSGRSCGSLPSGARWCSMRYMLTALAASASALRCCSANPPPKAISDGMSLCCEMGKHSTGKPDCRTARTARTSAATVTTSNRPLALGAEPPTLRHHDLPPAASSRLGMTQHVVFKYLICK